jgi:hypothetical protein
MKASDIGKFYLRRAFCLFPPLGVTFVIDYSLVRLGLLDGGISWAAIRAQLLYFANYYGLFFRICSPRGRTTAQTPGSIPSCSDASSRLPPIQNMKNQERRTRLLRARRGVRHAAKTSSLCARARECVAPGWPRADSADCKQLARRLRRALFQCQYNRPPRFSTARGRRDCSEPSSLRGRQKQLTSFRPSRV